jgi:hypothetical protein
VAILGLAVGACGGGKAPTGAVASSTTRSTASTTTIPPTPASAEMMQAATATVRAFMESRVAEAGAEGYLVDNAKAMYVAQVKLYDVASYTIGPPDGSDQRAIAVPVTVVTRSSTSRTEVLALGSGQSETVPSLPFVIRGVTLQ